MMVSKGENRLAKCASVAFGISPAKIEMPSDASSEIWACFAESELDKEADIRRTVIVSFRWG